MISVFRRARDETTGSQRLDAVAAALIAKNNPVIEGAIRAGEARGEARGTLRGKTEALIAVLSARRLKLGKKAIERIRATEDDARIDAWLACASTVASVDELFKR